MQALFIFPNQVFRALFAFPKKTLMVMVESEETAKLRSDQLIWQRARLQAVRERLLVKGYEVFYYSDPVDWSEVERDLATKKVTQLSAYQPLAQKFAKQPSWVTLPLPAFLLDPAAPQTAEVAKLSPKSFAIAVRRARRILVEPDGTPTGKRWLFPKPSAPTAVSKVPETEPLEFDRYWEEAVLYAAERGHRAKKVTVRPISFADAEDTLDFFLKNYLRVFGQLTPDPALAFYQKELEPLLDVGLLTPAYVLEEAQTYARQHQLPLPPVERFCWQLIGVREYARIRGLLSL